MGDKELANSSIYSDTEMTTDEGVEMGGSPVCNKELWSSLVPPIAGTNPQLQKESSIFHFVNVSTDGSVRIDSSSFIDQLHVRFSKGSEYVKTTQRFHNWNIFLSSLTDLFVKHRTIIRDPKQCEGYADTTVQIPI